MKAAFARVVESQRLYGETFVSWFAGPEISQGATPGQFVMLRCAEAPHLATSLPDDPLLPRPMSIHRMRSGATGSEWSILYDVVGRGTRWLASRQPGDAVYCWGALGRGFRVEPASQHLLLVAGGIGVAPLVWLADEAVNWNKTVTLILAARTRERIFPPAMLPPQVEVVAMTADGTLGERGLATKAFSDYLDWCDQAFACGPNAMFEGMAKELKNRRSQKSVQVLVEERMGCGTGICYGCAIESRKGMRLVCKDGPQFDLREIGL